MLCRCVWDEFLLFDIGLHRTKWLPQNGQPGGLCRPKRYSILFLHNFEQNHLFQNLHLEKRKRREDNNPWIAVDS